MCIRDREGFDHSFDIGRGDRAVTAVSYTHLSFSGAQVSCVVDWRVKRVIPASWIGCLFLIYKIINKWLTLIVSFGEMCIRDRNISEQRVFISFISYVERVYNFWV